MSERTAIEWTDHTFNIAWGCMKVSPGCTHCYADTLSRRYGHEVWGPAKTTPRRTFGTKHWADPLKWQAAAKRDGVQRRVFCGSMCDVFEDHPTIDAEREKLWPIIRATPNLVWQMLTKRPERIAANLPADWGKGYPNVWLGTSVESQEYADRRIPELVAVPAAVRFLSCEPLLAPVDVSPWLYSGYEEPPHDDIISWVIVGGESGTGARVCDVHWIRDVVAQCGFAGVPCFVKQLGARPTQNYYDWRGSSCDHDGRHVYVTTRDGIYEHREPNARSCNDGQPPLDAWVELPLRDRKGGALEEWPADLQVRQFPGEVVA